MLPAQSSEADRILVARDAKWQTMDLDIAEKTFGGKLHFQIRRRSQPLGKEREGGDYGKVSTRAWIWQERQVLYLSSLFQTLKWVML